MTTVSKVITAPLLKKIEKLQRDSRELRQKLEERKAQLDGEKINLQAKVATLTSQNKKLLQKESKEF